jgi:hypothetical protein
VPRLVGGVERTAEVVLADRSLHADGAFGDDRAQLGEDLVEVVDGSSMHGDGGFGGGQHNAPDRTRTTFDGDEGDDLIAVALEEFAGVMIAVLGERRSGA